MEIFGYDFMIDRNLKPWLIEVNTNPCLEETSSLLKEYLPRMLDDAFKLTLDVIFPPLRNVISTRLPNSPQTLGEESDFPPEFTKPTQISETLFKIQGHSDTQNLWR